MGALGQRSAAAAAAVLQQQHQQQDSGETGSTLWRWVQAPQLRSAELLSDKLLVLACAAGTLHVGLQFCVGPRPLSSSGHAAACNSRPSAADVEQVLPEEAEQQWPASAEPSGPAAYLLPEEKPMPLHVLGPMRAVAHVAKQLAQGLGVSIVEHTRPQAESSV